MLLLIVSPPEPPAKKPFTYWLSDAGRFWYWSDAIVQVASKILSLPAREPKLVTTPCHEKRGAPVALPKPIEMVPPTNAPVVLLIWIASITSGIESPAPR